MGNIFWQPRIAEHEIMGAAARRLDEVGDMFVRELKQTVPIGTVSRPMYRSGPYKGKYWTARDAGSLNKSVRKRGEYEGRERNVWVMVGHRKAYYGKIAEHYKPYFRPTISRNRTKARKIIMGVSNG